MGSFGLFNAAWLMGLQKVSNYQFSNACVHALLACLELIRIV